MKNAKLALTALMIGTMSLSGISFAEAGVKLDNIHIGIDLRNDEPRPPEPEMAPRPPERHGPGGPAPRPVHDRGPHFGPHPGGPGGPGGPHGQGRDVPPPPPPVHPGPWHGGPR